MSRSIFFGYGIHRPKYVLEFENILCIKFWYYINSPSFFEDTHFNQTHLGMYIISENLRKFFWWFRLSSAELKHSNNQFNNLDIFWGSYKNYFLKTFAIACQKGLLQNLGYWISTSICLQYFLIYFCKCIWP